MGLDVYAGTFTRYYARTWKTASQKFCEENGMEFHQIRTDDTPPPPVEEVEAGVGAWLEQLVQVLNNSGVSAEAWEDNGAKPYYTDKPDWDAFGALLLYGASKLLQKEPPLKYAKRTDFEKHPLINSDSRFNGWSLYGGAVCHWIPLSDSFMFNYPLPNGVEVNIGTTGLLKNELTMINKIGWNADRESILNWVGTEGYPEEAVISGGKIEFKEQVEEYDTESLAKLAFSVLWQAVEFSESERVPIILDF